MIRIVLHGSTTGHTLTRQAPMFMSRPALSTLLSPSSLRLDSLDAVTQMSGRRITRRRSSPSLGRSQGQRSRTRARTRSWRSRKRSRLCHGRRARGRRLGCHREVRDILDYPVQVRHLHLLHQQKLLQGDAIVITVVVVGILLGHVPVAVAPRHALAGTPWRSARCTAPGRAFAGAGFGRSITLGGSRHARGDRRSGGRRASRGGAALAPGGGGTGSLHHPAAA